MNSIEKGPRVRISPGFTRFSPRFVEHFVLFKPPLDQRERERGAINRHVELGEKKRRPPPM